MHTTLLFASAEGVQGLTLGNDQGVSRQAGSQLCDQSEELGVWAKSDQGIQPIKRHFVGLDATRDSFVFTWTRLE